MAYALGKYLETEETVIILHYCQSLFNEEVSPGFVLLSLDISSAVILSF